VGNFHVICEPLPGIVTTYEDNLSKTKVRNNSRLLSLNFTQVTQGIY